MLAEAVRQAVQSSISPVEAGDLTYQLVSIPSPTGEEEAASQFYAEYLNRIGMPARLQYLEPGRPNVIGEIKGQGGGKNLMLYGHIDTIPAIDCVPPKREEDVVWGRGAADMKGAVAAMALAARAILQSGVKLKGDLILTAGAGHEIPWPLHPTIGHGDGAKRLAQSIRSGEIKADYCVITEGPMDRAWVVQGGLAPWRLTITGGPGAAHATTTDLDHNPVIWASEVILDLYEYNKEINGRGVHPLIGVPPRLEIGLACGGDYFNRNPLDDVISGNIRWDPGWSGEQVIDHFRARLEAVRQRLMARHGDDSIRFDLFIRVGKDSYDSLQDPGTDWLLEQLQEAARPVVGDLAAPWGSRAATDLEIFGRGGGVPTIAFGPRLMPAATASGKRPGGAHSNDEGVEVEAVARVAQICAGLALEVCGVAS